MGKNYRLIKSVPGPIHAGDAKSISSVSDSIYLANNPDSTGYAWHDRRGCALIHIGARIITDITDEFNMAIHKEYIATAGDMIKPLGKSSAAKEVHHYP